MVDFNVFKRFRRDSSGNVAVMFALATGVMLAGSGAAVDYSRSSNARSAIGAAADAAAIAGAKTRGGSTQREAAAKEVFEANLKASAFDGAVTVRYTNIVEGGSDVGYRIEASGPVRAFFGAFTGSGVTDVATKAEARANFDELTEIVFVLDTTDSMEGDRIAELKTASLGVIDEITRRAPRADRVKMGVVPFAQYVNVGMANRNKSWIDVRPDYQTPVVNTCSMQFVRVGDTNCRDVSYGPEPFIPPGHCMRDGRRRTCGGSPGRPARTERVCDAVMSTTQQNVCTTTGGDWVRWNGCVGSRNYPLATKDERYDVKIPGIMGVNCASPLLELTTNVSQVRSTISGLMTEGETYLPAGLIWGWRALSAGEPLTGSSTAPGTRKFMILVTDGRNTKSPNYPAHDGTDGALADRLTRETCQNIATDRTNAVKVFTIAFEVDGMDVKNILQECANRTGGAFFDAQNASQLSASFGKAVDSIFGVKLTH
jgi:Flp pilus assembly protein TadG